MYRDIAGRDTSLYSTRDFPRLLHQSHTDPTHRTSPRDVNHWDNANNAPH